MKCEVALALDVESREEARAFLERTGPSLKWVKIGLQLYTRYGPDLVDEIAEMDYSIFLDLKLHDIPNTVAGAVRSIAAFPVSLLTLHASGGPEMLSAAQQERNQSAPRLRLLAVTALTSMDADQLKAVGIDKTPVDLVRQLARMASGCGIDGFVCSPREITVLREDLGPDAYLVTPGIRLPADSPDEQKRITTPADAAKAGANLLVVGRSLLRADNPAEVLATIQQSLAP